MDYLLFVWECVYNLTCLTLAKVCATVVFFLYNSEAMLWEMAVIVLVLAIERLWVVRIMLVFMAASSPDDVYRLKVGWIIELRLLVLLLLCAQQLRQVLLLLPKDVIAFFLADWRIVWPLLRVSSSRAAQVVQPWRVAAMALSCTWNILGCVNFIHRDVSDVTYWAWWLLKVTKLLICLLVLLLKLV